MRFLINIVGIVLFGSELAHLILFRVTGLFVRFQSWESDAVLVMSALIPSSNPEHNHY